jgi:hypothetical protein
VEAPAKALSAAATSVPSAAATSAAATSAAATSAAATSAAATSAAATSAAATSAAATKPVAASPSIVKNNTKATIADFINAQNGRFPSQLGGSECLTYTKALGEIRKDKKDGDWIWYIIPSSFGTSDIARFFNLPNANVTLAEYLDDVTLGTRYVEMLTAIGTKLQEFMTGKPLNDDDVKTFLVELMGGHQYYTVDYAKLKDSLSMFYSYLETKGKLNDKIRLLAQHFKIPPSPPSVPTPSDKAATSVKVPPSAAQSSASAK